MIRSMTAFARQGLEGRWGSLVWELRTVNHRYLDVSLRLPEELRAIESPVREAVAKHLTRGKVDANLRFQPQETTSGGIALDASAARAVLGAADEVAALAPGLARPGAIDILRWPGVLKAPTVDFAALAESAQVLLQRTLDDLSGMRAREGERLRALLEQRLAAIEAIVTKVLELLPDIARMYRERLEQRLQEIKTQLDPARLEQEIVLYAHKTDVAEELDRLRGHVAEVRTTLAQAGAAGRRLDFLMQELNREANTLASKAADIRLTNAAVGLKVLIEQMREQVQNIE